jgi:hypothetical protein
MSAAVVPAPPSLKTPAAADFLDQAGAGLQLVTRFLEYPNAAGLENASRCLQVVVGQLQACQAVLRAARRKDPELRARLQTLQAEAAHVNAMFREAGALFGGWKRILSARLGGYTRQGSPAVLRCRQHVTIRI